MRPQQNKKMIAGLVSAVGAAVLAMCLLAAGAVAAPNRGPDPTAHRAQTFRMSPG